MVCLMLQHTYTHTHTQAPEIRIGMLQNSVQRTQLTLLQSSRDYSTGMVSSCDLPKASLSEQQLDAEEESGFKKPKYAHGLLVFLLRQHSPRILIVEEIT